MNIIKNDAFINFVQKNIFNHNVNCFMSPQKNYLDKLYVFFKIILDLNSISYMFQINNSLYPPLMYITKKHFNFKHMF